MIRRSIFCGILRTGSFGKTRLEAFSDGVFAIVVTLLIIEIKVPEVKGPDISSQLSQALIHMFPKFLSYAMSFAYIAIYWVNHHLLFHVIKKVDRGLFWFNSFFLMVLAFIPFPTALIGEYPQEHVAVILYGVIMFLTALSFVLIKWYAINYAKLGDPKMETDIFKDSLFKITAGPLCYLLAIIFAFINPWISIGIYLIIPVIYFIPTEVERRLGINE